MNGPSLLAWGDLEARRRRRGAGLLARIPMAAWSVVAGVALAAWIARSAGAFGAEIDLAQLHRAARLWLATVICGGSLAIFGAPFRMYWRRDSSMLSRLPIEGGALFHVALARSARAATAVLLAPGIACAGFALAGYHELALRHLMLVGVAWTGAAMLGPAVTLMAGAIVASDKVESLIKQVGGEFSAPKTGWLGILPGLAATGVVLTVIASADWALGARTTALGGPALTLIPPALGSLLALIWALGSADRVMLAAVREVSALDQERLAYIERTRLSLLERLAAGMLGPRGRAVFAKDARLSRRRYPLPYFLSAVGVVALWIIAGVRPVDFWTWAGAVGGFNIVYALVMARRRKIEPIEHPRFVRTLALGSSDLAGAKRAQTLLWFAVFVLAGLLPVIVVALLATG